jgi:hypothetical protein
MLVNLTDHEDVFLGPDDEPPNRPQRRSRRPAERLLPLPGAYVRVPVQWLRKPVRHHVFGPRERLFLYVLYRSRWGQRGVAVTDKVAAEVGVASRYKRQVMVQLERAGWIRVERHTRHGAAVVWPIVIAG